MFLSACGLSQHGPNLFSSALSVLALNLDDAAVRPPLSSSRPPSPPFPTASSSLSSPAAASTSSASHTLRSHGHPNPHPTDHPSAMTDAVSRPRKVLYVANPGSDSDEDRRARSNYPPPRRPQQPQPASYFQQQYQQRPSPSQPAPLTTDLSHVNGNGTHHLAQSSQPPLSPDDSAGSPVAGQSTPPPATPSLHAPSSSLDLPYKSESPSKSLAPEPTGYYDRTPNEATSQASSSRKSRPGILQTLKAPFGSRPRPPADSPRRNRSVCPSYIIHVIRSSHDPPVTNRSNTRT